MDDTIDILNIDLEIRQIFLKETEKLPTYQNRLDDIEKMIENNVFTNKVRNIIEKSRTELSQHIENIISNRDLNFYILESAMYILIDCFFRIESLIAATITKLYSR